MLCFDDAALATLIRVLRAVPPQERSQHLQRLAAKHDPSRQLKRYYRNKYGRVSLRIEVDADSVASLLRSVGLPLWDLEKRTVAAAVEQFFEGWSLGAFHLVAHRDE
jgi:hypothetical protein